MPRLRYLKSIPNLYGQPGVLLVEVDHAAEEPHTGQAGVGLDTLMSETFLTPKGARALAWSLLYCATVADGKEPPTLRCRWCEVARKRGEPALPHQCEFTIPFGEVLSAG